MQSLYYSLLARKLGLVKSTEWGVAIRKITNDFETILGDNEIEFKVVNNTEEYWFADPLLFSDNGKTWLFVEAFNRKDRKGEIGYFEIVDGCAINFKIIIQTPTHMSYPFVFKHKDDFYMIPETGAAHHIALYKASRFPDKWELDTILLDDVVYRDSTVIPMGDDQYEVLSYKQEGSTRINMKNILTVFRLDMKEKKLIKISEFRDKKQINRPAGPCFEINGKSYRISQKCNRAYGEAIIVYEINKDRLYKNDKKINLFSGKNIKLNKEGTVILTHTYSQSGGYEVVDYRCEVKNK